MMKFMNTFLKTILTLVVLAGMPAAVAHHSVAGVFSYDNEFSLTGIITEVEWINPHSFVHLEVTDESGTVTKWELETAPTAFFRKAGVTKAMLLGDGKPVTITGAAPIDENLKSGWIYRITYSDKHFYHISTSR